MNAFLDVLWGHCIEFALGHLSAYVQPLLKDRGVFGLDTVSEADKIFCYFIAGFETIFPFLLDPRHRLFAEFIFRVPLLDFINLIFSQWFQKGTF